MKLVIIIAAIILGLGGLYMVTNRGKSQSSVPAVTMQTVQSDVANGGQLFDIRTAEEFANGHIDGAKNVTLQDIQDGKVPAADKSKVIYVYCQTGTRSQQAAFVLKNMGYQNIVDLGSIGHVKSMGGAIKS